MTIKDKILLYPLPAFALFILAEFLFFTYRRTQDASRPNYLWKDSFLNIGLSLGYLIQGFFFGGIYTLIYKFLYSHRIFDLSQSWLYFLPFIFLEDLAYYVFHRVSHESRFWWAAHETHHSSELLNFTTAFRQTWTGGPHGWVFWAPLPFLGFPVDWIFIEGGVSLVYQFFLHTEMIKNFGPLDAVMNSPSHHRVHHGTDPLYLDRNYGGIFIIWDRLFGTFESESKRPHYGVTQPLRSYNPLRAAFHTWVDLFCDLRSAPSWQDRARYLFFFTWMET